MWDEAPESMTHPPCCRARLLRAAIKAELSQVAGALDDGADEKSGAEVVW
jgi:hypothetical protein